MREKLIELLKLSPNCICDLCGENGRLDEVAGIIADNLIANGVTIPVRCKDCEYGMYAGLGKFMCELHDFVGKAISIALTEKGEPMIDFKEALETLQHEVYEEGHCSYIEADLCVAMNALEKQIPKPIRRVQRYWGDGKPSWKDYYCPVCSKQQKRNKGDEWYCERCGQKLIWEEHQ